jgi:hypothetical protein
MDIDQQLRQLDPAAEIPHDLGRSSRAEATFFSITSNHMEGSRETPQRSPQQHRWRRISIAAVATAAGVLVAPVLGSGTAYASWTAVPRPATAQEADAWGRKCLESWSGHSYAVRMVESRGSWSYTVLTSADGYEATCLSTSTPALDGSVSTGFSGPLPQTPAPDGLVTNSVREGALTANSDHQLEVTGKAGAKVAAVAFRIDGTDVQATLKDGYFAAWWPQHEGNNLLSRLTNALGSDGPPDPDVVITLIDGTTRITPIQRFDVSPN